MSPTPQDLFVRWLADRPMAVRVAVVVDGDRLLGESGVLGQHVIRDGQGRDWFPAVFRGDDLSFRIRFRKAAASGPTIVVITRGDAAPGPVDVSWIGDVLSLNEGGEPLDLSLAAYFYVLCPQINFPPGELRRHRDLLLAKRDAIPRASREIVRRWGRPDDWGRGQVAAMLLLARHPDLSLGDVWCDDVDPGRFVARGIGLLVASPARGDASLLRDVLEAAAQPQVRRYLLWFEVPPEELAGYVVLRLLAAESGLQNPANQLSGLGIFSPETPLALMEDVGLAVARSAASDPETWKKIVDASGAFLTERRVERLLGVLPEQIRDPASAIERLGGIAPAVAARVVLQALRLFFLNPRPASLDWAPTFDESRSADALTESSSTAARILRAMVSLASTARAVERALEQEPPTFRGAEALLDWYVATKHHTLELEVARMGDLIQEAGDEGLVEAGIKYLFGGADDLDPVQGSLKRRVRDRLDFLDGRLAEFIAEDPQRFCEGPRSVLGLLRRRFKDVAADIRLERRAGRLWILIFDGMRFDTWQAVLQPIVAEHFAVESEALFAVLPTYTAAARTSMLAGVLPPAWRGYGDGPTGDESVLLARNLGLSQAEAKARLRLVTGAKARHARFARRPGPDEGTDVNAVIYAISDDCHEFQDDLARFNLKIRNDVLGDRAQGVRGILDDLLARIRPEDTVLATSDHGFTEMLRADAVPVSRAEAGTAGCALEDDVNCRYVKGFRPKAAGAAVVEVPWPRRPHFLPVGGVWFKKETARTSARYDHGGLSLAEIVVPAAVLRRVTEKLARVELDLTPDDMLSVHEDATADIAVVIANTGNLAVDFDLRGTTNLGETALKVTGHLAAGEQRKESVTLVGQYRVSESGELDPGRTLTAVFFRLKHTDLSGQLKDAPHESRTLRVDVKAKRTKLTTDALKGFDDI